MNRRNFLTFCSAATALLPAAPLLAAASKPASKPAPSRKAGPARPIDRQNLVARHNPHVTRFDPNSALSLGNGEFAFTVDATGLQTLAPECAKDFALCTTAHWAWHSFPANGLSRSQLKLKNYDTHGRQVGYATDSTGQEEIFNYLRQNPHRLHLGHIGFHLQSPDHHPLASEDLTEISQTLELWTGLLQSRFNLRGQPVRVETAVHPEVDLVAVRVESPLLTSGELSVRFAFYYGSPEVSMADWTSPEKHTTEAQSVTARRTVLRRTVDSTRYLAAVEWSGDAALKQAGRHVFELRTTRSRLEFVCHFASEATPHIRNTHRPIPSRLPDFRATSAAAARHWKSFWTEGGAIDLSGSTDPRAEVLEHRTVLSLYQTAIHCSGSLPSAETGLLFNSWYGKFHLEMHWWHSVHFAAWNRFRLMEPSMGLYRQILPIARELARSQGYRGARWPKMIGPDGYDSPSPVGPLLLWQQPHPIYYAELFHRERPTRETLEQWKEIVFDTAEFMANYAHYEAANKRFVLGPPLKTVSENTDAETSVNPLFELCYWRYGLRVAQAWRERLGLSPDPNWQNVLSNLAPLPTSNGLYLMQEGMTDMYEKWNWEHPALLGACGMLPGDDVDPQIMRATVRKVMEVWQWDRTWGWDFGLAAMAAARVGEPDLAIRALTIDAPKNKYWPNGHNYQRPNLTAYLPGNGSFLCAMAMMAAGWTGGPQQSAPGFPRDGRWQVRHEDLKTWI